MFPKAVFESEEGADKHKWTKVYGYMDKCMYIRIVYFEQDRRQ